MTTMNDVAARAEAFQSAAIALLEAIHATPGADEAVAGAYPFERSFEDVVAEIQGWTAAIGEQCSSTPTPR